ncbi:hypothetical protein [Cohnella herbarum]|uniref:Asp/Glu/hydantoin racemase n=1 Tax=Cohnella herbarum TaxID=2728023 RepID=A0A7Z2VSA6_9BACL|nr:hypothetical protein [Cohnella herbarum]QJD88276.1 hypothetical protein HH215_21510 [Cohnella herbarum]
MHVNMKIGCLHAHHSNIEYIEQALSSSRSELLHFVDPALVYRISSDGAFGLEDAMRRVKEQLEWIAGADTDAILITCTNYIAVLQEEESSVVVPVLKIDEPFFESVCACEEPQLVLFTNPATVEGTMGRLREHARKAGRQPRIEVLVLEGLFDLFMQGKKEEHRLALAERLRNIASEASGKRISVGQLSMSEAAKQVREETGIEIGHPLEGLASYIERTLCR